jgi:hypothetical protein
MAEFDRSGLSAKSFAELSGVKYQTFAGWLHLRRKRQSFQSPDENASQRVAWLEAVVGEAQGVSRASSSGVLLLLPGGTRAEITCQQQIHLVAALLRALEKPC